MSPNRRAIIALSILFSGLSMFGFIKHLFAQTPDRDRLVMDVIEELKRRKIPTEGGSYLHEQYALVIGPRTIGLQNLFAQWRPLPQDERRNLLRNWLDTILNAEPIEESFASVREMIVAIVRSRYELSINFLRARQKPDERGFSEIPSLPMAADVANALAIDRPNRISIVNRAKMVEFGVSFAVANSVALENLKRLLPPFSYVQMGDGAPAGVFASIVGDDYQSSYLLLPERFPPPPVGEDWIVLALSRNFMAMASSKNDLGIEFLVRLCELPDDRTSHPCTRILLRLKNLKWSEFVPSIGTRLGARMAQLKLIEQHQRYATQRALIEAWHMAKNIDIFPGQIIYYKVGDVQHNETVWGSLTTALLPRAEHVAFLRQTMDQRSPNGIRNEHLMAVKWEKVVEIVGDMMEEDPHLFPPRYLVKKFPSEAQLAALKSFDESPKK